MAHFVHKLCLTCLFSHPVGGFFGNNMAWQAELSVKVVAYWLIWNLLFENTKCNSACGPQKWRWCRNYKGKKVSVKHIVTFADIPVFCWTVQEEIGPMSCVCSSCCDLKWFDTAADNPRNNFQTARMGTKGPSFEANRGAHRRFCWRVPAIFANGQPVNGYCYAGNGHEWTVSIRIHPKKTYIVVTKNNCIALENRRLDPFAPALLSSMFCTTVVWSFDALSIAWVVELPDIFGLGNQNVLFSLIFPTAKKKCYSNSAKWWETLWQKTAVTTLVCEVWAWRRW